MRKVQTIALGAGPLLCAAIVLMPAPAGLSLAGQGALAILALCVVWWLFTPVPLPATSLMGLALIAALGVLPPNTALSLFGNQAVFFVIGVFLMAAVMVQTGASARLALLGIRTLARNEDQLCMAVLLLSWGLCALIVSHAVAAFMLPLVLELIRSLELTPRSRTARRLLLSMAWGTVAGSNLTLMSSARASLARELYLGYAPEGASFGLLEFSLGSLPASICTLVIAAVVLRVVFPPENLDLKPALDRLNQQVSEMGPISRDESTVLGFMTVMIVTMVMAGPTLGLGTVALLFAALLFAFRILSWEDAERNVNWGIAMLYGGAIAVGTALDRSGAATWLVGSVLGGAELSPWATFGIIGATTAVMTELVSNAAVIAMMLPVAIPIAEQVGMDPRILVWLAPIAAGFAFVLPTSTPALAMVFGTGYLRVSDTLYGGFISLLSLIALLLLARFVWPLLGIQVLVP